MVNKFEITTIKKNKYDSIYSNINILIFKKWIKI